MHRKRIVKLLFLCCVALGTSGCLGHLYRETKRSLQCRDVGQKIRSISKVARVYGGVRGVRLIRAGLYDRNEHVRLFTLETLAALPDASHAAAEAVLSLAEHDTSPRIRRAALRVFWAMEKRPWHLHRRLRALGL